jgi:hypothetical protein
MSEHGQDFEGLKRLLKLKRHEIPPPGYFNDFSAEVVSRIRAGESRFGRTLADRLENQAPWLLSFLRVFEVKPGVIGAFATCLCLLLVLGVVVAEHSDSTSQAMLTTASSSQPEQTLASSPAQVAAEPASAFAAASDGGIVASTNPVTSLQPVATLFGQPNSTSIFQPASFTPSGN